MLTNFKTISVAFFTKIKRVASGLGFVILFLVLSISSYALYDVLNETSNSVTSNGAETDYAKDCNVVGIKIHGDLATHIPTNNQNDDTTASEDVVLAIKDANEDEGVKAILLEIDSSGGYAVAGEEVAIAVKNSEKPVIGLIRETGISAAYLAVSSADKIFASKNSDVGSIGVTMSYLSNAEKNKKEGYTYEQLSSGKFKDSGAPDLPLTKEERDLFMRDINIVYNNFIKDISVNRNIPIEKVKAIADGSTVLGEQAKELGLIDEIGGINEASQYLEKIIGEKPEICWQ